MNIPVQMMPNTTPLQTRIYKFTDKDKIQDRNGNVMFHFPYFKNTFWTNFRYSTKQNVKTSIVLITNDRYEYEIVLCLERHNDIWYDTTWSLPSINTDKTHSGVFIKFTSETEYIDNNLEAEILGFIHLYPDVEHYLLLAAPNVYQFVMSNYEGNELINPCGSIYNVENLNYISDILPKAVKIHLISEYG
jgi:hypothetical protein